MSGLNQLWWLRGGCGIEVLLWSLWPGAKWAVMGTWRHATRAGGCNQGSPLSPGTAATSWGSRTQGVMERQLFTVKKDSWTAAILLRRD